VFDRIARRKAVSPEASDAMIQILKRQTFDDMIPRFCLMR
jgi:hypothetical protein